MLDIASQCGPARASLSDPWIRRTALQRTYIVRRLPRRERGKQISRRRIDTETPRALTRQLCPNSRAHSHGCSYSRARRHQHARGQHTTRVRDGIREKREHARGPTGRARTGAVARPSPWRPSVSRPPCARTLRGARRAAAVAEQSKVSDRGRTRCRAWKGRTTDHALAQDVVERDCGDGATRRAGSSARALDKTRTAQRRTCAVVVPARGSARPRPATKLGAHLR